MQVCLPGPPPRRDITALLSDVRRDVLPSGTMHGMDSVPAGVLDPTMPPGATGLLRLTVQDTMLGRPSLTGPYLRIDGDPVPVAFGENPIKVHAGRHQVQASMSFGWPFGRASLDVHIPDGGELAVWYAPSFSYYVKGRLGTEPQKPAGSWYLVLVGLALVVGLVVAALRG